MFVGISNTERCLVFCAFAKGGNDTVWTTSFKPSERPLSACQIWQHLRLFFAALL